MGQREITLERIHARNFCKLQKRLDGPRYLLKNCIYKNCKVIIVFVCEILSFNLIRKTPFLMEFFKAIQALERGGAQRVDSKYIIASQEVKSFFVGIRITLTCILFACIAIHCTKCIDETSYS